MHTSLLYLHYRKHNINITVRHVRSQLLHRPRVRTHFSSVFMRILIADVAVCTCFYAQTHTHSLCGALTIIEGAENRLKCLAATEEYHVCGIWKQFNDRTSGGAWVSICLDQYIIEMSDFLWLSNGIQQNIAITCYSCWFLITCIWRVITTVPIHTTHTRIHHRRCWRYCTALSNCSFSFTSDMKYRQ